MTNRSVAAGCVVLGLAFSCLSCGKLKISLNDKKKKNEDQSTIGISSDTSGKRKLLAIPGDFIDKSTYEKGGSTAELDADDRSSSKTSTQKSKK